MNLLSGLSTLLYIITGILWDSNIFWCILSFFAIKWAVKDIGVAIAAELSRSKGGVK